MYGNFTPPHGTVFTCRPGCAKCTQPFLPRHPAPCNIKVKMLRALGDIKNSARGRLRSSCISPSKWKLSLPFPSPKWKLFEINRRPHCSLLRRILHIRSSFDKSTRGIVHLSVANSTQTWSVQWAMGCGGRWMSPHHRRFSGQFCSLLQHICQLDSLGDTLLSLSLSLSLSASAVDCTAAATFADAAITRVTDRPTDRDREKE